MSKLNQIQNALLSIDQAQFQKLCDSYLHRILEVKEINSIGSVAGENKTRTGQPDALITLTNARYIFLEATTEKSGLLTKFSSDLDECFREDKTGVLLAEVDKIILACNRKLSHKDKTALIKKGQEKNCIIEFLDLDTLSFDLYQKFQPLAKEFLGIELDTGQILKPEDFIEDYQKSKFATPLDNDFFFRETEKKQILESLQSQDLIIISGKSGVGKSKLAVECAKQFVESNLDFQPFFITNKNRDIYENLKAYFGADGDYLIIVDDANRLSQLYHILRLLNEQTATHKIKMILTVRDYALNQIKNETKNYLPSEIELQKFSYDETTKILEEGFGIRNHDYISKIYKTSGGNSRLAIMMAKVALEKNTLDSINDVSDLYDIYFDSINEDLKELGNEDLIQFAGIISFFRTLDRANSEFFEIVAQSFSLTPEELWIGLEKLHSLEIVDLDFEIAKISDQILGTYLFYKAFFKDEILDFSILLSDDFERLSYRLVDSLNPVLNTFNTKFILNKLQPHIDKRWTEIKDNEQKALSFMKLFYYLKETEFLVYLKRQIDLIETISVEEFNLQFTPRNYEPVNDKYLEVLKLFQTENIEIVLEIIFGYLEKNLNLLPQVIYLLTHDFCFNRNSPNWNYLIQEKVISKLIEKSKGDNADLYQKIFLIIANKFAQMHFKSISSNGDLSVTIYKFKLTPLESMVEIRVNLWKRLIEIYQEGKYQADIFKIIRTYNQRWLKDYVVKEIVEKDIEILLPFIKSLSSESYQNCVLAHSYFDFLEKIEVKFDESLREEFTNKTFEISEVLLTNDRWELKLGWDEYEKYKQKQLESYFESYQFNDYKELFEHCREIQSHQEKLDYFQIHFRLSKVLVRLAETNSDLFIKVINYLFESGNSIYLSGQYIIHKYSEKNLSKLDAYENIKGFQFNLKNDWLFGFLQVLDKKSTNEHFLEEIYELYKNVDLKEIPQNFEYLSNYSHLDKDILPKIIRILLERVKNEGGTFNFHHLFNYSSISEDLSELLSKELDSIKEIYIYQQNIERYPDHDSRALKQIFLADNSFIFDFLEFLLSERKSYETLHDGNTDFSFIWEQDNYRDLFKSLLDFIYEKERENQSLWLPSYIELCFCRLTEDELKDETKKNKRDEQNDKAIPLLKEILKENAKDKRKASYIFQLVVNNFGDKKKDFLAIFLTENKNLEDFKWLDFETNHVVMADMGSEIPRLEYKIKFLESLLPLFNSVDLLEHKLEIKTRIQNYEQDIINARKRDFIGHY